MRQGPHHTAKNLQKQADQPENFLFEVVVCYLNYSAHQYRPFSKLDILD